VGVERGWKVGLGVQQVRGPPYLGMQGDSGHEYSVMNVWSTVTVITPLLTQYIIYFRALMH
jgi:hypothetical protein